jgi:hypothetical protein
MDRALLNEGGTLLARSLRVATRGSVTPPFFNQRFLSGGENRIPSDRLGAHFEEPVEGICRP